MVGKCCISTCKTCCSGHCLLGGLRGGWEPRSGLRRTSGPFVDRAQCPSLRVSRGMCFPLTLLLFLLPENLPNAENCSILAPSCQQDKTQRSSPPVGRRCSPNQVTASPCAPDTAVPVLPAEPPSAPGPGPSHQAFPENPLPLCPPLGQTGFWDWAPASGFLGTLDRVKGANYSCISFGSLVVGLRVL